jgi:fructan beta-fructosidase
MAGRTQLKMFILAVGLASTMIAGLARGQRSYDQLWRPQYHFTPAKNFMNDPNGLVYYQGEYHLFYQHNPQGTVWGHMSWGHAVSTDMLHWKHLPVAIPEQEGKYMIYSGSAVVDWKNSSGLCEKGAHGDKSCLVAIYTAAGKDNQRQHLAYSNDRGRTWKNYSGNPVADLGQPDFRDPKVFWYEAQKKWVMVAVLADERLLKIFDSKNLREWKLRSTFGPARDTQGQWECPDLFELPVEGTTEKKWVLIVNRNPGAPAGGTGTKYFIGSFDGEEFTDQTPAGQDLWADYGKDFYATNTFADVPKSDGRKIWMGWISNWQYANLEPTEIWRGGQSIPRVLGLRKYEKGIRMVQEPVREMKQLRGKEFRLENKTVSEANQKIKEARVAGNTLEIEAELRLNGAEDLGFKLLEDSRNETLVGIAGDGENVFIDRNKSGESSYSKEAAGRHGTTISGKPTVKFRIFVDRSSVELFVNDGEVTLTERVYPPKGADGIEIYSTNGAGNIMSLSIWKISSVWN